MIRYLMLLLTLALIGCGTPEATRANHAVYCANYKVVQDSLDIVAMSAVSHVDRVVTATRALQYHADNWLDARNPYSGYDGGPQFCECPQSFYAMPDQAHEPDPSVKPTAQLVQGSDGGHPGTGAAVGAGAGWLIFGGPLAIAAGAVIGAVVGSKD